LPTSPERRRRTVEHLKNAGIQPDLAEQMAEPRAESPTPQELLRNILHLFLNGVALLAYERHRLRYVHTQDDGSLLFVCICDEAFDRSSWNHHIADSFKEVA